MDPTEVVVDFISSFHTKFTRGIFWINCGVPEMITSGVKNVEKVTTNAFIFCHIHHIAL